MGPASLARGFGLVGVETWIAQSAKEAFDLVNQAVLRKDVGVVLISREFFTPYAEKYFQMRISMERPIVLEIPAVDEKETPLDGIEQFVKKAAGVTV